MGRGLSDLQKRILIAIHRLEKPGLNDLRAKVRDVAKEIYGDEAKSSTNRAAFARAVTRLQERGLLSRAYPGLSTTGRPKTWWLVLTDEARSLYRLTRNHAVPTLTDSQVATCRWLEEKRLDVATERMELAAASITVDPVRDGEHDGDT